MYVSQGQGQPNYYEFCRQRRQKPFSKAALREHYVLPYGCNGGYGACKGKVLADGGVAMFPGAENTLTQRKVPPVWLFCCPADFRSGDRMPEIGAVRDIPDQNLPCRVESIDEIFPRCCGAVAEIACQ